MVLLGDEAQVDTCFSIFGESANLDARYVHGMRQTLLKNLFGRTRWYFLVMRLKWILVSVYLEIVLILTQDRCMIFAECIIASKSFWTHPIEHLGNMGRVESYFGLFGDSVCISAR
jgi:hypothetical protein